MSEISDLMASNDPMATPVMSLGPPPPVNTSPPPGVHDTQAIHEKQVEQMAPLSSIIPKATPKSMSKLKPEQKTSIVVGICAFLILLPNVQQMLNQHLPVLSSNATLHVVANSTLIALLFFALKDHISDLL